MALSISTTISLRCSSNGLCKGILADRSSLTFGSYAMCLSSSLPMRKLRSRCISLAMEKTLSHVDLGRLVIPSIPCSFPKQIHQDYARLKEIADAWMLSRFASLNEAEYYSRFVNSQPDLLVAMAHANGVTQRVLLIMKFMVWFVCLDTVVDACTNTAAVEDISRSVMTVFESHKAVVPSCCPAATGVILDTATEWWDEMCEDMSPTQQSRFVQALKDYFEGSIQQFFYHQECCLPVEEDYMSIRLRTTGWYIVSVLTEYSVGMELDEETLKHPLLRNLQEATSYHIAMVNDLLSFRMEYLDGSYVNLVALLYMNSKSDLQDVVEQVYEIAKDKDKECSSLINEITKRRELREKPGMQSYLEGVSNWLSGNVHWHLVSARYKQELIVPSDD